jgi:hypothetical protein
MRDILALGFDPSLTGFGWCVHNPLAKGKARVVDKGRISTSARDIFVTRYMYIRDTLLTILSKYPEVVIVGVESPPFGEQYSEGLYGLFLYVNEAVYLSRKDVVYFDPLTIKFLAKEDPTLRKGKMFKDDMIALAKADTGVAKWNGDQADAYHVSRFAARLWMLLEGMITEDVLLPTEKHTFLGTHTYVRGKRAGETDKSGSVFRENDRFFRFSKLEKVV